MPMNPSIAELERFMAAIRRMESGSYAGNYQAVSPHNPGYGTAKGAYQILDSTWNGFQGYADALSAPPSVQDMWARQQFTRLFNQYGNWEDVASVHFTGQPRGVVSGGDVLGTTPPAYISRIDSYFNSEQNPYFSSSASSSGAVTTADDPNNVLEREPWSAPAGGRLFNHPDGNGWIVRYQVTPGVWIEWATTDREALRAGGYRPGQARRYRTDQNRVHQILTYEHTSDLYDAWLSIQSMPSEVDSVQEWFEFAFQSAFGANQDAANDPGIQRVILEVMANPDISPGAIQTMVENTPYWQQTTDAANTWRDLSEAEQEARVMNVARDLVQDHRRLMGPIDGRYISINSPEIQQFARLIASGENTYGEILQRFEDAAMGNEMSPFFQQTRDAEIAARQFGVDIENTAENLRAQLRNWGVTLPEGSIMDWASQIQHNFQSMADFQAMLEQQASVLYPNRPAGMRTIDYAQPWIATLERTLETSSSLTDPRIQSALQGGLTAFDFQRELMQTEDWLYTENAADRLTSAFGQLSQQMGFD